MMLAIVLLALVLVFVIGGVGYNGGAYRAPGIGLGGLLLIVLLVLLLTGAFR